MGSVFFHCASAEGLRALAVHANDEHIHIVEAGGGAIGDKIKLALIYAFYRFPIFLNIGAAAPHMRAGLFYPTNAVVGTPVACAEKNIAAILL